MDFNICNFEPQKMLDVKFHSFIFGYIMVVFLKTINIVLIEFEYNEYNEFKSTLELS